MLSGDDVDKLDFLLNHYSTKLVPSISSLVRLAIRELYKNVKQQTGYGNDSLSITK
jgi:hypothetical protein